MSHIVFNAPPGWPPPPPGWLPPVGWKPPADWPSPPEGWDFLLELPDTARVSHSSAYDPHPGYGVRPPRKPAQREPEREDGPDGWFPGMHDEEEMERQRYEAAARHRRRLIGPLLAVFGAMLLVSFFLSLSNDSTNQALLACGQAVRNAVDEQTAQKTDAVAGVPTLPAVRNGSVYNSVSGETSALTIEGTHTTAEGEGWTFSCLVDATSNPPLVLEADVVRNAASSG